MEQENAVEAYWERSEAGPAKKWYRITNIGLKKLTEYKDDIEIRKRNLDYFLTSFREIFDSEQEG